MSNPANILDYAKRPRSPKRWITWIVVVLLFMGALLATFYKSYAPGLTAVSRRFVQMRNDRTMMSYEPPAGLVVWDDTTSPPVFGPQVQPMASRVSAFRARTPVFMHGRRAKSGEECLVVIELVQRRAGQPEHLAVTLYEPATLTKWTRHHGPGVAFESPPIVSGPAKKIYAGRADPKDQSHFTIDFDIAGVRHTLDGWLVDVPRDQSGATVAVKMSDRMGPMTKSAADTK